MQEKVHRYKTCYSIKKKGREKCAAEFMMLCCALYSAAALTTSALF